MSELRDQALIDRLQRMYLEGDIDGVAFVAADANRCEACGRFDGKLYTPSTLPPLPVPDCSRSSGCRCHYEANVVVPE